ncbi:MAG TPA: hypothetical protein VG795_14070, partial [Acidimicrobiia bacterium]|nr:hypothetical protein [Acidimicrobiia bacterium]
TATSGDGGGSAGSGAGRSSSRVLDTPDGADDTADSGRPARVAPRPVPTRRPGGAAAPRPRQKRRRR